jgi:hypothetical protein
LGIIFSGTTGKRRRNEIAGHGPSYTEFTPVAYLFDEYIAVTVKPVSPIRTGGFSPSSG